VNINFFKTTVFELSVFFAVVLQLTEVRTASFEK